MLAHADQLSPMQAVGLANAALRSRFKGSSDELTGMQLINRFLASQGARISRPTVFLMRLMTRNVDRDTYGKYGHYFPNPSFKDAWKDARAAAEEAAATVA